MCLVILEEKVREFSLCFRPSLLTRVPSEQQAGYVAPAEWQATTNRRWIQSKNIKAHLDQLIGCVRPELFFRGL